MDPFVVGTVLGFVSAIGYTAANVCLRAVAHCDPVWVSCIKAVPTVALVSPWIIGRVVQSQTITPSLRLLGLVVMAGLVGQLGGNVLFQWSLGVVGIALAVPLTLGTMIASSVSLGRRFLGEPVSRRTSMALSVLVAAIFVLAAGAPAANQAIGRAAGNQHLLGTMVYIAAGVIAASISGVAYCLISAAIRHASTSGVPLSTILVSVGSVGMLGLGAISAWRIGPSAMWNTDPVDMSVMLLAGVCNAAAFWALGKALHLTGLVYVNALNASQTALAALAGVALFGEAPTMAMGAGVGLTIVGLLLMKNDQRVAQISPSVGAAED
jgi:drug/metabolite transporter (DMT)-like permease